MKVQRKDAILKLLTENRMMKAGDLAAEFEVSMETIRRDLSELEDLKLIRRVHGGAVLYTEYGIEPDYTYRTEENYNEKLRIGQKAAEIVNDGDSIIIDLGTTTLEFARFLKGKKDLTVLTNSIKIAYELMANEEITVIFIGGKLRHGEGTTSGYWSEEMVDNFFVDKLFVGVGALTPENGIMDYHIEEANLRRHFVKRAKQVIALADYSKFGIKAMNVICKTEEINCLITDDKADKNAIKEFRKRGIKVDIV